MKDSLLSTSKDIRRYLWARSFVSSVMAWSVMTLVLQAKGLSYFEIGVLNSFGAFISILSEVPTGRLADTFGQKYALTAGAIFTALGLSVLALADSVLLIYVSEGVTGIGLALSSGADSAWLFTEHRRLGREDEYLRTRSVIGSISMPFSIGANALAPVLLSWSTSSPVWISAVLYCLAAGIWARLAVHRRDEDSSRVQHRRQEVDLPPCLRAFHTAIIETQRTNSSYLSIKRVQRS